MARMTYAAIVDAIEAELQDSSNAVYSAAEMATILASAIKELPDYSPFEVVETVHTTSGSKILEIGSITNLVSLKSYIEYEVDCQPQQLRGWEWVDWHRIRMLLDRTPAANEHVYVYCNKVHKLPNITDLAGTVDLVAGYVAGVKTIHIDAMGSADVLEADMIFTIASDSTGTVYRLTQDTTLAGNEGDITFTPGLAEAIADGDVVTFENSTLTPQLERWLIQLAAARAVISKGGLLLSEGRNAITVLSNINSSITNMQAQLTQGLNDLQTARTQIDLAPAIILEANTAIDGMTSDIAQALTDIAKGRVQAGTVPVAITQAQTKIDAMSARITQAVTDIGSGRTEVQKGIALVTTSANGAIAKIDAEVAQALSDLDSGRSLINTIGVAANPQTDYAQYAQVGIANSRGYLDEAVGFMRQASADESLGSSYGILATRELQAAVDLLNQANGYLRKAGEDNALANTYGNMAIRDLGAAGTRLNQGNGYLSQARADESLGNTYGSLAQRQFSAASMNLSQSASYINKVITQLRIAQTVRLYREEGERRLALVLRDLRSKKRRNVYQLYPTA